MTTVRTGTRRAFVLAALGSILIVGCGGSGGSSGQSAPPPPPVPADWNIVVNTANVAGPLQQSLIGFYDLSGFLLDYENVPGLISNMNEVGFGAPGGADWRIGVGRWENSTELFNMLTDTSVCPGVTQENESAFASDLELLASRDWFTYTDGSVVESADIVDDRFYLDYVRSVIDNADTFGATPFLSIDLMPRALSINQTPNRLDCGVSFTNSVSNNEPASPTVFAEAVAGMVERVVEGTGTRTGNERPRPVQYWEVWNEPELATFWEPTFIPNPDSFFNMAIATLTELDAYRAATADVNGQAIRIGLGSFVSADTAIATIQSFDAVNIPMDFISFHGYGDDPLSLVDDIGRVAAARENSNNYQDIELVFAEWGPDLATRTGDQQYAASMDPALHAATVVSLGAALGLDRSHKSIIYDFYPVIALGLIDNSGTPRPLYRAYELMAKLVTDSAERLTISGLADGRLDAGMGAALVARDTQSGVVRVLLVNRNTDARVVQITLDGVDSTPAQLFVFDASADPANSLPTVQAPGDLFTLPARSIAIAEF